MRIANILAAGLLLAALAPASEAKPKNGNLSPFDFGWKKARTGEERYQVLFNTHTAALKNGVDVDYKGIKEIDLVVPEGAQSIPLTRHNDFKGAKLHVLDNTRPMYIFSMENHVRKVAVTGRQIDAADYSKVNVLSKGYWIVGIEDATPWVRQREGRNYPATRREVLLVRDGKGSNGPCAPYDTPASKPRVTYAPADDEEKTFCNLSFYRDENSTRIACLMRAEMQNNLHVSNIYIHTPHDDESYGDHCIAFTYCTNLVCENIEVDGTYSQPKKYGYGICCNPTWHATFRKIKSACPWGVFGNNNTHDSLIEDCDVERFDNHCYGRDITIRNSVLTGRGLPVSSIFGTILIENCLFEQCLPYSTRADYYSYVPFELIIRDSEVRPKAGTIIGMGRLDAKVNERPELAEKAWPNVTIENLTVRVPKNADNVCLFRPTSRKDDWGKPLKYLSRVSIKGLKLEFPEHHKGADFSLSSLPVEVEGDFNCTIEGLETVCEGSARKPRVFLNIHGRTDNYKVEAPGAEIVR